MSYNKELGTIPEMVGLNCNWSRYGEHLSVYQVSGLIYRTRLTADTDSNEYGGVRTSAVYWNHE